MDDKPSPGSAEAVAKNCKCPVVDNHRGRGYMGDGPRYGWVQVADCPLHGVNLSPRHHLGDKS